MVGPGIKARAHLENLISIRMATNLLRGAFLSLLLAVLPGCAPYVAYLPVALPAIVSGVGGGISYTFTNIAYKATTHRAEEVREANLKALEKMSLDVVKIKNKKNSIYIKARSRKFTIHIDLDKITPTLTKISVNVKKGWLLKDKTTAYEIIYQTDLFLADLGSEGGGLGRMDPAACRVKEKAPAAPEVSGAGG